MESRPRRLGNWQVPRWAPTRPRPLEYRPNPKPICDLNGHFLPGAPRGTSKCFGHFTGTWELPRKITRKVAAELAQEPPHGRFTDWLNLRVQRPKVVARLRVPKREKEKKLDEKSQLRMEQSFKDFEQDQGKNKEKVDNQEEERDDGEPLENKEDPFEWNKTKEPVDEDGNAPYIPGSLTEPDKRHESYDLLVKKAVEEIHGPQEDDNDKFWRKVADNAKNNEQNSDEMKCKKTALKLPAVNVSQNFNFAKKMHVVNLEHQPLPDTLGYRNLTKIGEHRDSDIVVKPYAIGWKGYGAAGPTCCTKMRVHRPKTCDTKKLEPDQDKQRPSTSAPNLGGQYKKSMSLMDLAICWDFRPSHANLEPKFPKHIDGTNGSKAPAVFTMVHTPKEDEEPFQPGHANPIFTQKQASDNYGHHAVPYFERDMSKNRRKDSCDVQHCPQHAYANEKTEKPASRRNSAQKSPCDGIHGCGTPSESRKSSKDVNNRPDKLQPIKQAWNSEKTNGVLQGNQRGRNSLESYEKTPLAQGKLQQSSPNDSQISRQSTKDSVSTNNNIKHKHCLSCNGNKVCQQTKLKEDYKFAFKAGNPNSVQSNGTSTTTDSKGFKVPKMRDPYTKKSYTIPTLSPPFSIWKDADATGYPEHWRLASVYQHAYKPPEQRRKALVSSVYQ